MRAEIQKYTRTLLALLVLCASLLFTLSVRPTPAYAEETSISAAQAMSTCRRSRA